MLWKDFLTTWNGAASENRFHRILLPLLAITNILLIFALITKDKTTVLVPQGMTEVMEVSIKKASGGYKKAWGIFVANQVGNVTPGNVEFMVDTLSPMLAADLHARFRAAVAQEIEDIKKNNLSTAFEPKQVIYEPQTDKVFVVGRTLIEAVGGAKNAFDRVFEVRIDIRGGMPLVTHLEAYQGAPRTIDYITKMRLLGRDQQPPGTVEVPAIPSPQGAAPAQTR